MKRIHIFKAGEQISSTGFKKNFTEGDLQSMVESFDPNSHEPPIRVGHEDNDKVPAFGWVRKLEKEGPNLYAYVDLTSEMEDMIKKGHYRKVSASFYSPASEVNPKKGHYTLKHVAMLGGTPPAVKGLEPFGFSESEGEIHTMLMEINFIEESNMAVDEKELAPVPTEEKEDFSEEKKKKKAPKIEVEVEMPEEEEEEELPEEEDMEMSDKYGKKKHSSKGKMEMADCGSKKKEYSEQEEALIAKVAEMEAKFAEISAREEEAKVLQARLEEMEAKFAEMEAAKAEAEALLLEEKRERRREYLSQQVEALYSEGQMTEGAYAKQDLFDFAVGLEEGTLEFSEGESAADKLLEILSRIPAPVNFGEIAPEAEEVFSEATEEETEVDFVEKVESYANENGVSFEEALRKLSTEM